MMQDLLSSRKVRPLTLFAGADGGVSPISLLAFASDSRSEGANDSLPNEIDANSSGRKPFDEW